MKTDRTELRKEPKKTSFSCPHCGKEINPGKILSQARGPASEKQIAAARRNSRFAGRPRGVWVKFRVDFAPLGTPADVLDDSFFEGSHWVSVRLPKGSPEIPADLKHPMWKKAAEDAIHTVTKKYTGITGRITLMEIVSGRGKAA